MSNFVPVPLLAFARSVANLLQLTPAQTGTVGMVKPGTAMTVAIDGTINPEFGTTTGTVADGGALSTETTARVAGQSANAQAAAAAQETADAAMPNTVEALTSLLGALPTSTPETSGILWANGGVLQIS